MKHLLYDIIILHSFFLFANDSVPILNNLNTPNGVVVGGVLPSEMICRDTADTDDTINCFNDLCGNFSDRESSLAEKIMEIADSKCIDELKNYDDEIKEITKLTVDQKLKMLSFIEKQLEEIRNDPLKGLNGNEVDDRIKFFIKNSVKSIHCDNTKERFSDRLTIILDEQLDVKSDAYKKVISSYYEALLNLTKDKDSPYQSREGLELLLDCGFFKEREYDDIASKLETMSSIADPSETTADITINDLKSLLLEKRFAIDFIIDINKMSEDVKTMIIQENVNFDQIKNEINQLVKELDPTGDTYFKLLRTNLIYQCIHDQYAASVSGLINDIKSRYAINIANLTDPDMKENLLKYFNEEVVIEIPSRNLSSKIKSFQDKVAKEPEMDSFKSGITYNIMHGIPWYDWSILYSYQEHYTGILLDSAFPHDDWANFSGNDNPPYSTIYPSIGTLVNLEIDDSILAHEAGHLISEYLDNAKKTDLFIKKIEEIEKCLNKLHPNPLHYQEEMLADTISAIISKTDNSLNPFCDYAKMEGLTFLPEYDDDPHPTSFFRLIYFSFLKDNYPASCQRIIKKTSGKYKMKKCM